MNNFEVSLKQQLETYHINTLVTPKL
jgi:hypothetical protein